MAVPKRKVSRMKRGNRRSADALSAPTYVEDKESGELRRPHHIDLKSGKYRGRQILGRQGRFLGITRRARAWQRGHGQTLCRRFGRPARE